MSKSKNLVVEELDPDSLGDVPELHKKHYLELGYKPYLMGDGKIKWLTNTQRVYKETKTMGPRIVKSHTHIMPSGLHRKRKKRNKLLPFLRDNWLILFFVVVIVLGLLIIVRFMS